MIFAIRTLRAIEKQANLMQAQFDQWVDLTNWRCEKQLRNNILRIMVDLVNPTQFPITYSGEIIVGTKERRFDKEVLSPKRPKTIDFDMVVTNGGQAAGSVSFQVSESFTHWHKITKEAVTNERLGRLDCTKWQKVDKRWHAKYTSLTEKQPRDRTAMKTVNSYRLIAYQVESGKVVFDLANYAETHTLSPGTVLIEGGANWEIIGLREDSTPQVRRIDVKKVD